MTVTVAEQRVFGNTRLVVDLFGPLINISEVDAFMGTDPRYRTEDEIARHPRIRPKPGGATWSAADVSNETREYLEDPRRSLRLIDTQMCRILCNADSSTEIAIVSAAPDESVFLAAQRAILKYTNSFLHSSSLDEDNFFWMPAPSATEPKGIARFLHEHPTAKYTVVVDDSPPFSFSALADLTESEHYDEWFSGQLDKDSLQKTLRTALQARARVHDAFIQSIRDELSMPHYHAIDGFVVYDDKLRGDIKQKVKNIERVLQHETTGTPICVFLGGPPGSGKSYFVKLCALRFGASEDFASTSLSSIPARRFVRAIERHIEIVYNRADTKPQPSVAFLDEIDTVINKRESAFRFLMDAMTGSRTDDLGVTMRNAKSGNVQGLVWFFAGSAGRTRREYVQKFSKVDRKVRDFFDRVHFSVELPGVDVAGQAILQALNSIRLYDKKKNIEMVHKNVLLLFGATPWTSSRQLNTVCRLALADPSRSGTRLELAEFYQLGTLKEFHDTYAQLIKDKPFKDHEYANIAW